MLTARYKATFNRCLEPLATWCVRLKISPSAITFTCPAAASLICVIFLRTHAILPFCVAIVLVGCLDALDGAVARVSGRVTHVGAYLDAMADRYVEVIVALTVAQVSGEWLLVMLVLSGSFLVSYAKARAAIEVRVTNEEWPDLMERTERDVLFILGFAASAVIPWRPLGHDLFWWTLVGLVILISLTVSQRMQRALRLIRERGR